MRRAKFQSSRRRMAQAWLAALLLVLGAWGAAWARGARLSPEAEARKFERVTRFGDKISSFRRQISQEVRRPSLSKKTALAAIAVIMDRTSIRVGSERYACRSVPGKEASFGASSLRKKHVQVQGNQVRLSFRGKSGVAWDRTITDPKLARTVKMFREQPGERLWQVPGRDGQLRPVTERHVRTLFRKYGAEPKDLRTLLANHRLEQELSRLPRPCSKQQAEKNLSQAIKSVATFMGHRPSTCRASYLYPPRLQQYLDQLR
jgi:DNA topoisomerase-1